MKHGFGLNLILLLKKELKPLERPYIIENFDKTC